jgi:hypothetical protein
MSNDTPIEDRVEEAIHNLLDFMDQENNYSDDYKSMFSHLTKVMELRQKETDSAEARSLKLMELQQQRDLSQIAHETKLTELQQQRTLSEVSNEIRLKELQQQKSISDDAHSIKLEELEQRKAISKEALLTVGTHIAGLVVLMNHERAHVIASKAFGLVKKIF